jgi:hypothetical protein
MRGAICEDAILNVWSQQTLIHTRIQDCKPEEGLRGLARAAEDNLALGALSQEWAHHLVCCKVPPRHIDEHLQWINDPTKSNFPHTEDYPTPEWHS